MSITAEEQVEVDALFKGFFDILLNKSLATNSNLHKTDYRTEVAGVTKIYIGAPEEEKSSSQYDVIADEVLQEFFGQVEKVDQLNNSDAITASQSMIISKPVNESIESLNTPPQLEVRRSSVDLPSVPHPQAESTDVENNAIEPEKSKTEAEQPMEVVERMMNFAFPEKDADQLEEDFEVDKKFRKSKKKSRAASTSFYVPSPDHDKDDVEKMKERAEKNKLFMYIKIPEVPIKVSYKGEKEKNQILDVADFHLQVPTLEYHNVTWTWLDLLLAVKGRTRESLIAQALKQKFFRKGLKTEEQHEGSDEEKARILLGKQFGGPGGSVRSSRKFLPLSKK